MSRANRCESGTCVFPLFHASDVVQGTSYSKRGFQEGIQNGIQNGIHKGIHKGDERKDIQKGIRRPNPTNRIKAHPMHLIGMTSKVINKLDTGQDPFRHFLARSRPRTTQELLVVAAFALSISVHSRPRKLDFGRVPHPTRSPVLACSLRLPLPCSRRGHKEVALWSVTFAQVDVNFAGSCS